MGDTEIGTGKTARRAYRLDDLSIVPSRRTRDHADVDTSWQIDAYRMAIPVLAAGSVGAPVDTAQATALAEVGALPVVDLTTIEPADAAALVEALHAAGHRVAARCSPKRAAELAPGAIGDEFDLLIIQGDIVSAEHVSDDGEPLNLKTFIRGLDIPVLVGGCASHSAALHLMRSGAAGVLVGVDRPDLGIGVPLATAVADARSARVRHLDETGVYCHLIALSGNGGDEIGHAGAVAKALACGADAVMMSADAVGDTESDLGGLLRRAVAACGYTDLKNFQKAELVTVEPS